MNNDSVLGVIVPCLNEEKNLNNFYLLVSRIDESRFEAS